MPLVEDIVFVLDFQRTLTLIEKYELNRLWLVTAWGIVFHKHILFYIKFILLTIITYMYVEKFCNLECYKLSRQTEKNRMSMVL